MFRLEKANSANTKKSQKLKMDIVIPRKKYNNKKKNERNSVNVTKLTHFLVI